MKARFGADTNGVYAALALLILAFPILLVWGDGQWFGSDEWSFIANRKLPSGAGLFGNHNGHWVTIPLVLYRVNYELFGLHSYVPYQILVILSHLTIAGLMHMLMRRAGVRAWIATGLLVAFVFLGAGWGNILFAFQITLNGSVIAGLAQFVLADHKGAWSRRDTLGVSIAVLGLMTSAVMPALSVGVGAFVLLNRGWRVAAAHTVPPAVVFGLWWMAYGGAEDSDPQPWRIAQFAFHMIRQAFEGIGQSTIGGVILMLIAALGMWTAFAKWRESGNIRPLAIPVGLLTAAIAFASLTGFNRSGFGVDIAGTAGIGRYMHVCAALLLPIIAIGAQKLWTLRKPFVLVPLVVVALAMPDNADQLRNRGPFTTGNRDLVLAVAHSPYLDQAPGDLEPLLFQEVRVAWLRRELAAGALPDLPIDAAPLTVLNADASLALTTSDTSDGTCEDKSEAGIWRQEVERGTTIVIERAARLFVVEGDNRSSARRLNPGDRVRIQAGPIELELLGVDGTPPVSCLIPAS
ncbi:MAG: hypothetical protein ACI9C1_001856 [Candidatus Aldehydirespiratoraceae bacterium]|jgi:hypothetical protein